MKKNITINLFGQLYAIDEDAYELLKKYEDTLRAYFSKQEGGDEIADDIEHRVAELLSELKEQGYEAICIEQVQDIIGRIGNPEQMGSDENESETDQAEGTTDDNNSQTTEQKAAMRPTGKKRLFRNTNDQMLGGVMSGLACYFGGDPLLWRLLIIILCFVTSFTLLLVYIVFWIIVPAPKTPEDYLQMKGIEVTPDNIAQIVVNDPTKESKKIERSGLNSILAFCMSILKILLIFFCGLIFLGIACTLLAVVAVAFVALAGIVESGFPLSPFIPNLDVVSKIPVWGNVSFWLLLVSCATACIVPLYVLIHWILRLRSKVSPMSITQRIVCLVVWIVSIGSIAATGYYLDRKIDHVRDSIKSYDDSDLYVGNHYSYWNRCYKGFDYLHRKNKNDNDGFMYLKREELDNYDYTQNIDSLKPGIYRFSIKGVSDGISCDFQAVCKAQDGHELTYSKQISDKLPGKVIFMGKKFDQVTMAKTLKEEMPECVIDSVIIFTPKVSLSITVKQKDYHPGEQSSDFLFHSTVISCRRIGDLPKTTTQPKKTKNPKVTLSISASV